MSRIEFVKDLGYLLSFSVFDEASVTEWKGRDLKLANQIPNIDILVIAVKRVSRLFSFSIFPFPEDSVLDSNSKIIKMKRITHPCY